MAIISMFDLILKDRWKLEHKKYYVYVYLTWFEQTQTVKNSFIEILFCLNYKNGMNLMIFFLS